LVYCVLDCRFTCRALGGIWDHVPFAIDYLSRYHISRTAFCVRICAFVACTRRFILAFAVRCVCLRLHYHRVHFLFSVRFAVSARAYAVVYRVSSSFVTFTPLSLRVHYVFINLYACVCWFVCLRGGRFSLRGNGSNGITVWLHGWFSTVGRFRSSLAALLCALVGGSRACHHVHVRSALWFASWVSIGLVYVSTV
jgi:hypothetical protein